MMNDDDDDYDDNEDPQAHTSTTSNHAATGTQLSVLALDPLQLALQVDDNHVRDHEDNLVHVHDDNHHVHDHDDDHHDNNNDDVEPCCVYLLWIHPKLPFR